MNWPVLRNSVIAMGYDKSQELLVTATGVPRSGIVWDGRNSKCRCEL